MHDVIFGKDFESFDHLAEVNEGSFFREGPFLLHKFIKGAAIAVLVNEVKVVDSFEHVDVPDDVRTVLDGRQNVNFIDGAFFKFRDFFELLGVDDLDGDFLFSFHVDRFVYFAIDALSELFKYGVVFDNFAHVERGERKIV